MSAIDIMASIVFLPRICAGFVDEFVDSWPLALAIKVIGAVVMLAILADIVLCVAKYAFGVYSMFGVVI